MGSINQFLDPWLSLKKRLFYYYLKIAMTSFFVGGWYGLTPISTIFQLYHGG